MNNYQNNSILSGLSTKEYQRLSGGIKPVQLSLKEILIEANQPCKSVYFPTQGVVSLLLLMQNGSTTEIGLIGTEGMVGIFQFLGAGISNNRAMVQIEGEAMQLDINTLQAEFDRGETLQKSILNYASMLFIQVSQTAGCNNRHTVKQRVARWMLMMGDRSEEATFYMTHEFMSKMLGVRRTGVTEIAKNFQRSGIIDYHRGRVTILNHSVLETISCECYRKLKNRK